jgi:hypothetical protein
MLAMMPEELLAQAAQLPRARNGIEADLARMTGRPVSTEHLGEWIVSRIFDIQLEASASAKGIDGRFRSGPLQGRTVNVKCYMKHQGLLDTTDHYALEYHLILAGPAVPAGSSRGTTASWCIDTVYLFDALRLKTEQLGRGIRIGIASSVTKAQWLSAEIYPRATCTVLPVTPDQETALRLFRVPYRQGYPLRDARPRSPETVAGWHKMGASPGDGGQTDCDCRRTR